MIDLIQWRVGIGMWCCRMKYIKRKNKLVNHQILHYNMQSHSGIQWMKDYHWTNENQGMCINILRTLLSHTSVWLYTLTVCIFLQLILSGDVESNPGPVGELLVLNTYVNYLCLHAI